MTIHISIVIILSTFRISSRIRLTRFRFFDCIFLRIFLTEKKRKGKWIYEIMNIFANEFIAQFNNFDTLIVNNN